jgi:hypothetical protein
MRNTHSSGWALVAAGALLGAFAWSVPGAAGTVAGQAQAVQGTVAVDGSTSSTTFADTGTLGGATDAREASQDFVSDASISAEALHAATIGWDNQVDSEASVANLALTINGTTIGADFVMAKVTADKGTDAVFTSVEGLTLDGAPLAVDGSRNQQIPIAGGTIIVNEQNKGGSGTFVNALHIIIDGSADVIIASASAKAQ